MDYIHETVLRDIIDILSSVKDSDEVKSITNGKSYRSAAAMSKDLILTFPVIYSSDISLDTATMISKAMEKKCATMMQMLFSAISVDNSKDAIEYIKKYHTNINFGSKMDLNEFIDTMDKIGEAVQAGGLGDVDQDMIELIKEQVKYPDFYLPDSVSESSINDYKVLPAFKYGNTKIIKEDIAEEIDKAADAAKAFGADAKPFANRTAAKGSYSKEKDQAGIMKDTSDYFKNQVLPGELKKANELMPTTMVINFNKANADGNGAFTTQAVIGIKAKLYPCDSSEVVNKIKAKVADNNGLLKFIKATTHEISFFRDFLFAIDKAKLDAISVAKKDDATKMFKVLERRANKSKIKQLLRLNNNASAITTLVVSQNIIEYLKKEDNIDLERVSNVYPIMNSYNFMCFTIVDENMEVAKFLFDTGEDSYETLSFTHLEREASDNSYKKIINLMTKMQR